MRLRSLKLNQGDSIMELRIIEKLDNILKLLKGEQLEDGFMDINGVVKWSSLSKSSISNPLLSLRQSKKVCTK